VRLAGELQWRSRCRFWSLVGGLFSPLPLALRQFLGRVRLSEKLSFACGHCCIWPIRRCFDQCARAGMEVWAQVPAALGGACGWGSCWLFRPALGPLSFFNREAGCSPPLSAAQPPVKGEFFQCNKGLGLVYRGKTLFACFWKKKKPLVWGGWRLLIFHFPPGLESLLLALYRRTGLTWR